MNKYEYVILWTPALMASCFNFYSFPGYEFLISTITFLISTIVQYVH